MSCLEEMVRYPCAIADEALDSFCLLVRKCSNQRHAVIMALMFKNTDPKLQKGLNRFDLSPASCPTHEVVISWSCETRQVMYLGSAEKARKKTQVLGYCNKSMCAIIK
jgi:hypothetical protein